MGTRTWSVSEAKAKLSDVIDAALKGEPQFITRRGAEAVVVIPADEYRTKVQRSGDTLVEFFARSPHRDVEIAPERNRDVGRDIEL
jgi:prevent-host-death family protein